MSKKNNETHRILQGACKLIEDKYTTVIEMVLKIETIANSRKTVRCLSWHCNLSSGSIMIDELEPGHIGYVIGQVRDAIKVEPCYRLNAAVSDLFEGGE